MLKTKSPTTILKTLISIPSYVDSTNNESVLCQWLYNFLAKNTNLKLKKQFIAPKRFNVLAFNSPNPEILITGHLDTIQPQSGWKTDPFKPIEKEGKIYGLGASDMKSGLAAILSAILKTPPQPKVMFLFYCDEEYDFLGMKRFIKAYQGEIRPKLIVSADGEGLEVGNSCRGLIEMTVTVKGQSGHAADPDSGINAILSSFLVVNKLKEWLKKFSFPTLDQSTFNLAFIRGGVKLGQKKGEVILGREGNIIPDYCQYVAEVRTATNGLTANKMAQFIKNESLKQRLRVSGIDVRHDLRSWTTPVGQLKEVLKLAPKKRLKRAKKSGYIDIQMLWETFNQAPSFTFGPSEKGMAHKPNEFIRITNLKKAEQFLTRLLASNARRSLKEKVSIVTPSFTSKT